MALNELSSGFVETKYGKFKIAVSPRGLIKIDFPSRHRHRKKNSNLSNSNKVFRQSKTFLNRYFSGSLKGFATIPIDWSIFTPFDKRVLTTLMKVRPGKTITYGELAKKSKFPGAARAVGNALNRNPIPVLIPCHRVLRKDLTLGGYRGGLRWKKILLEIDKQYNF